MRGKVYDEKNIKAIRDLQIMLHNWEPSYRLCKQCVFKFPFTKDLRSEYKREDLRKVPFEGCEICGSGSIDRFNGYIADGTPLAARLIISGFYRLSLFYMLLFLLKLAFQKLYYAIVKGLRVSVEAVKMVAKKGLVEGLAELGDLSWRKYVNLTDSKCQKLAMNHIDNFFFCMAVPYYVITGKNIMDALLGPPKDFVEYDDWHLLNEDLRRNANHTDSAEKIEPDSKYRT